ncbi:unnamed protein product, partial [Prorocentrum cordatum]
AVPRGLLGAAFCAAALLELGGSALGGWVGRVPFGQLGYWEAWQTPPCPHGAACFDLRVANWMQVYVLLATGLLAVLAPVGGGRRGRRAQRKLRRSWAGRRAGDWPEYGPRAIRRAVRDPHTRAALVASALSWAALVASEGPARQLLAEWKKWAPWRHSTYASTTAGWDTVEAQMGDGGQSDPITTVSLITSLAAYQGVGEKSDPTITAALDTLRRKAQEEEANAKPAPAPPKQRTGAQLLADANRALKELDNRIEKQRTKLTGAQLYLDDQLEKMDKLAQQRVEVQQRHLTALQQANQESGIIVVRPEEKTLNVKFEYDGSLFEGLEERDIPSEEMDSIMQWKSELEQFQKEQLGTLQAKFKYIEEIHQKANKAMQAPTTATPATASNGAGAAAINPEDEKKKIRDANQLMSKLTVWLMALSSLGFSEAQSTQQQSEEFQVLFGNITERGPQVQNYVQGPAAQHFDCLAFVETHKGPNQVSAMKTFLQKEGWSAGELVATRTHIQATSLEHWKGKHDKQGDSAFVGFSPMVLHLSIGNFIIIAAYLLPTLRFAGRNRKVMAALAAFVRLLKDPWLVVADWNCFPTELLASGWVEQMRALPTVPRPKKQKDLDSKWSKQQAYRDRPLLAQKLANSYGRWIEAVEEAVLQHSEVPQHQRDGYRGRAQGFGIKWKKSTASPGRPHLYNYEADWWAITHTQVIAINGLVKNNKDPQQLLQRGQEFRQRIQQVHVVSKHNDIELLNQWQQMAHDIFSPARQEREDVIEITERLAGQAARRALADGTKGFIRWAQDMWKKTPGALHRWTKDTQQPRLEEMISGKIVADPILIMSHKSESWAKKWTAAPHRQTALAGTEETVEQQMVELVDEFIIQAEKRRLPGKQQSDMVDLGTDVSGMGKRTQKKARARQRKAKQRAGKIFRLRRMATRVARITKGLFTTGDEQWQLPFIDDDGKCDIDAIEYTQLLEDLEYDLEMIQAGYECDTNICERCKQEPETIFHRIYTCTANTGIPPRELTHPVVNDIDRQDYVRRRVGIGVATMKMIDGKWSMSAGTMADLPGRRQTVPRAETMAFAIAIEETRGDIVYVTDHYPLLTAWTKGRAQDPGRGKNADLWARIKRAVMDTSPRHIGVEWTPSHQDEDEAELVNPIFAMGNSFADALATVAAEASWERVCTPIPRTDEWDAICAHVRLRARQALADTANIDPWCAERPSTAKPKAKRDRVKEVVDKMKQHDMVRLKNKWFCTACRQYITADALQEFAMTECNATYSTANEIAEVKGDRFMDNGKIHCSHVYGQDALNKIRDGRYPGYRLQELEDYDDPEVQRDIDDFFSEAPLRGEESNREGMSSTNDSMRQRRNPKSIVDWLTGIGVNLHGYEARAGDCWEYGGHVTCKKDVQSLHGDKRIGGSIKPSG